MANLKISYNAPVVLTFSLLCVAVYFVPFTSTNQMAQGIFAHFFILEDLSHNLDYPSLVLYALGHASVEHLLGNLTFILLLGPIIEEKYGSSNLTLMMIITAFATGLLNVFLFNTYLLGASGIVFLFIILASFGNAQKGIPLTFLLVAVLFLGKEILNSLSSNNISEFAHILGGVSGSLFGFMLGKRKEAKTNQFSNFYQDNLK